MPSSFPPSSLRARTEVHAFFLSHHRYIGHDNDDRNKMIRFFSFDGSLVNLKGNVVEVLLAAPPPSIASNFIAFCHL